MTHFGFIASAYALGVGVPVLFALDAARRLTQARRRLADIDPRAAARRQP